MRGLYLTLTVLGAALPYFQLIPWLMEHGPNMMLLFKEIFSSHAGAFFALDVLISAVVLIGFICREGAARGMNLLWLPIAATCLIGVSCGLPLFLYLRERQSAA